MNIPEGWPTEEMIRTGAAEIEKRLGVSYAHLDAKEIFIDMLAAAPTPPAQPSVHEAVLRALELAMIICDSVPSNAHNSDDPILSHLGKLVNFHEGHHGYAIIRDTLEAVKRATPPAQEAEPVAEVISYREIDLTATIRFFPILNGRCPFDIGAKLYTRPQSDELRKAAEKSLPVLEALADKSDIGMFNGVDVWSLSNDLRDALEKK
jgi:hypothetical protein